MLTAAPEPPHWARGLTLIELIVTLAVAGVIAAVATPSYQALLAHTRADQAVGNLARGLRQARLQALKQSLTVTVCPSPQGAECGGHWEAGAIAFIDRNGDGERSDSDRVIHRIPATSGKAEIRWSAFPNTNYLQMTRRGLSRHNGTFVYCPGDGAARDARALAIARTGRVRAYQDRDNDGIVEDGDGKALECP